MKANGKVWREFEEAKVFVRSLGLKNQKEWSEYSKSGKKPADIPSKPASTYKKYWKSTGDWIGSGFIPTFKRKYRSFVEARDFVRSLVLKSGSEWDEYCRSGKKPIDIPNDPRVYRKSESNNRKLTSLF